MVFRICFVVRDFCGLEFILQVGIMFSGKLCNLFMLWDLICVVFLLEVLLWFRRSCCGFVISMWLRIGCAVAFFCSVRFMLVFFLAVI